MVINLFAVAKLMGPLATSLSVLALLPAAYSVLEGTTDFWAFLVTAVLAMLVGKTFTILGRRSDQAMLTLRELFLFTATMWGFTAALAAIPICLLLDDLSYAACFFETASAMSTTGATAIAHLDVRPQAVLLWRSLLQLLGGIGFVVIAVAVLPQLSMGGMNIFKTESTSFENSSKFTPHAKTMAITLLAWYLGNLVACTVAYKIGGMDLFLAFNAACCTVATGGMMPLDASMNGMSPFVHYSASFFMFLMSSPFLIFIAAIAQGPRKLFQDQQIRGYFIFVMVLSVIVAATLYYYNNYSIEKAFRVALFNVTSVISTTGFALEDFTLWNPLATLIFLLILPIGGCSGSTSGGLKIFRLQVCASLFKSQIIKSVHPHRVVSPRFNNKDLDSSTISSIITFLTAYVVLAVTSSVLAAAMGLNLIDAITGSISCISNVGPALGPQLNPSNNFAGLHDGLYALFAFDMLAGRLEIIPVCICLTRMFWR